MAGREDFCKSFIKEDKSTFDDILDINHVDEKSFYMTKNAKRFYLGMQEHKPHRTTRNTTFPTR